MWLLLWAVVSGTGVEDREALKRVATGDGDALAELYDRHGRLLYSLALHIVRDAGDAEEVVQEAFAQLWQQAARYDDRRGSVAGWLVTVARSRAIDRLRWRRARIEPSAEPIESAVLIDPNGAPDDQLLTTIRAAAVRAALADLPLGQRVVIELAFFEGMTHVEISRRLEIPLGTAKTRIRDGLLALRARLAEAIV
jgi:RNA polymerase sigma-70 factor (ECF subfamily)